MKYDILLLGKTKDSFLHEGINEYYKRLKHYTTVSLKMLKPKKIQGNEAQIKEKEGDLLISHVSQGARLVALDGGGKQYTSADFAGLISNWENQGIRSVAFVIGGPLGLSDKLLAKADNRISLSKMTFTHDMVRLFLLEQLYRAYTIKAGEKYHK